MSQLILKPFHCFTYVTTSSSLNSPGKPPMVTTIPMLNQSSFSNLSITSPMTQLILQPGRHFTYVTAHSPTEDQLSETLISSIKQDAKWYEVCKEIVSENQRWKSLAESTGHLFGAVGQIQVSFTKRAPEDLGEICLGEPRRWLLGHSI